MVLQLVFSCWIRRHLAWLLWAETVARSQISTVCIISVSADFGYKGFSLESVISYTHLNTPYEISFIFCLLLMQSILILFFIVLFLIYRNIQSNNMSRFVNFYR
jgi:hypothetical protein